MAGQHPSIIYKFRNIAIYMLVLAAGFLVRQLPRRASLRAGAAIGDLFYRAVKRRRQIALKNLKMALGNEKSDRELGRIARRSFQNMGKTLVEFLCTPRYSVEELREWVRIEGMENFSQAMAEGKGVIFISAHLGNWELSFQIASSFLNCLSAVAQSFKCHRLDRLVNSYRTRYGGQIIKKEAAVKESLRRLRQGHGVAFLADQDAGTNGIFVDFFGVPASTTRGPIMLALRTGASVIYVLSVRQKDDSYVITFSEFMDLEISGDLEKDIEINTAKFVRYLENNIREYPCQWLWMHNRWKTRSDRQHSVTDTRCPVPGVRKSILVLSDGKPGHYNQSLGITDRINDVSIETIHVKFKDKRRDNLLRIFTRLMADIKLPQNLIRSMLKWAMESSSASTVLNSGRFDAILSTGSSVASTNLLLGQLTGARTVVCTRPSPVGIAHFDLAILPEHTKLRRRVKNAISTLGVPNRITSEFVRSVGSELAGKLNIHHQRVIGLLMGGDDRHYSIPPNMASDLCDVLMDTCKEMCACLVLTTSRRTDPETEGVIKSRMSDNSFCPFLVLASEPQQGNPVPGILGISDVTIVTEDSFSMVCEAASSGRKIIILKVERRKKGHARRHRVYKSLVERGYAKSADISELKGVVLGLLNAAGSPKALDDAQVAADALRKLIEC